MYFDIDYEMLYHFIITNTLIFILIKFFVNLKIMFDS